MKGIFLRKEWVSLVCCFCIIGVCLVHTALGKETKALFPMMGVRVVLDAGHGGWDPGKTGTGGENEKILNLAVTEKLTDGSKGFHADFLACAILHAGDDKRLADKLRRRHFIQLCSISKEMKGSIHVGACMGKEGEQCFAEAIRFIGIGYR